MPLLTLSHSYGFSIDGKFYPSIHYPGHHAAEQAGRAYYGPTAAFFTARVQRKRFEPYLPADDVLLTLEKQAETQGVKYDSEPFLADIPAEMRMELSSLLSTVLRGWLDKYDLTKNLCGIEVDDVKEHKPL